MRKRFEMTEADLATILEACKPVPMIALQCGSRLSQQERANAAWVALGQRMGFDGMSVQPTREGDRVFTAEAKEDE